MQLEWLEDFLTLAKTRNFSLAAEIRNTTQPAFSRRIRRLEDWVGEALVDRRHQPVALTRAGESFLTEAETLVAQLATARGRAASAARAERETLLFAATHMLATEFFPAWLERLEPSHGQVPAAPQTRLNCHSVPRCFEELAAGHVDFMLCPIPHAPAEALPLWERFDHQVIGGDRMIPVSVPDRDGTPKFAITPEAPPLPLLMLAESSVLGRAVHRLLAGRRGPGMPRFETVFESPLKEAVRAMALKGHGIAWLPERSVMADLCAERLVPATTDAGWSSGFDIRCYRRPTALSPSAARFWERIRTTTPA